MNYFTQFFILLVCLTMGQRSLFAMDYNERRLILNGHFNCKNVEKLLATGAQYYLDGHYTKAQTFWEQVILLRSENKKATAVAWYNLGHAYCELKEPQKTQNAWRKAAQQKDDFFVKVDALYNLFALLHSEGKHKEAYREYTTLKNTLENAPSSKEDPFQQADAFFYLSDLYAQYDELKKAKKYYLLTYHVLERIGREHTNRAIQIQAFEYLEQLAIIDGNKQLAQQYQKNLLWLEKKE